MSRGLREMFTHRVRGYLPVGWLTVLLISAWPMVLLADEALRDERPNLGQPVSNAELDALDFVILPDGSGLPAGSGTAATGLVVFQTECRICHGEGGQGGPNDRLVGGVGTLVSNAPVKTIGSYWPYATTLFDYLRRAMPYHAPGSMSDDDLYGLTAYLLSENGVISKGQQIDANTLPDVKMPNRAGFKSAWSED